MCVMAFGFNIKWGYAFPYRRCEKCFMCKEKTLGNWKAKIL